MSKAFSLSIAALSAASVLFAQSSTLSGPVPGFTFDAATGSIRAVIGSLGSASLGPELGAPLDSAWVAPRQNYGVAVRGSEVLFVAALGGSRPLTVRLPGAAAVPNGVAWSDDGSVAVLYSQSGSWIQVYSGFPASIQPGSQVIIPLAGSLSAIAVDPHGQRIAIGMSGDQNGVYQFSDDQGVASLMQLSAPVGLTFSADGSTLYALDQTTNQIFGMNLANSAIETWPAGAADAIAIRAAQNSAGANVVYVAGRSSRILLSIDPASHLTTAAAPLSFTPSIIEPLGASGFLLTRRTSPADTLWSFTNTAQPMVYFVPATTVPTLRREVPNR